MSRTSPAARLHEGIDWQWETFAEYLDALETMPRTIDVGAQLPHAAVRAYVLGERAHEYDVTPDEIAQMVAITRDALAAGAFGFSTSRTFLHTSKHGLVPGTHSTPDEVIAIAEAVRDSGHGVFQYVSDDLGQGGDEPWLDSLKAMGCPTTYTLAQTPAAPTAFRTALDEAVAANAAGSPMVPQVAVRPTGMLYGLQSSFHPFIAHPSYRAIADLPLAERAALSSRSGVPPGDCSTRTRSPTTRSPTTWRRTGRRCTDSAILPTTSRRPRRAPARPPNARAAIPARSCSTGCVENDGAGVHVLAARQLLRATTTT